jgi:hypothetical protein
VNGHHGDQHPNNDRHIEAGHWRSTNHFENEEKHVESHCTVQDFEGFLFVLLLVTTKYNDKISPKPNFQITNYD